MHAYGTWPGATASVHTVLRDGRILTCGTGWSSGTLYRFQDSGSIDNSFGGSGIGSVDINVCGVPLQMTKLAGDTMLVYGQSGTGYALAKFDSAGNLCSDFGTSGSISRSIPLYAWFGCTPTALAVQPDGKILIAASANTFFPPTVVMRMLPNGDYDTSFGSGGYTVLPFGSCGFKANKIFLQSSGKIIITGDNFTTNSRPYYGSGRLRIDGVVDSTYGTNGEVHTYVSHISSVTSSYQQADEKVVLAGSNGYMLRYTANGLFDTTFQALVSGNRFLYQHRFGNGCIPSDIIDDSAGRHYVYGRYQNTVSNSVFYWYYVMRLKADGQIDSSFNGTGYFDYPIRTAIYYPQGATTRTMQLLPGNKMLLYGDVNYYSTGREIFLSRLYIHPLLEFLNSGHTTSFCAGDTARMQVHTSGAVRWMRNGTLLADTGKVLLAWQSGSYTAVTTYLNGQAHDTSNSLAIVFYTPVIPSISALGNSLQTYNGGSKYQWYDAGGNAITGAVDSLFSPSAAGTYFVAVTDSNGCTAKSNAYRFVPTGISTRLLSTRLRVYPNPVREQLYIANDASESLTVTLSDMAGRVVWQQSVNAGNTAVFMMRKEGVPAQNFILHARGRSIRETHLVSLE